MKLLTAFHVAESIDLRQLRKDYTCETLYASTTELLFKTNYDGFLYIAHYGVVAFFGMHEIQMSETLEYIRRFSENPFAERLTEEFKVREQDGLHFEFDLLTIPDISEKSLHVIFFNMAQSLALDYYLKVAEGILNKLKGFAKELEVHGKLHLSKKQMLKFVGHSLSMKNAVTENLYIFDSPQLVWEDEYLDQIHVGLVRHFDLRLRFKEVENTFSVIDDNLHTFHEVLQHRESAMLEWIIILLILIEVGDMLLNKLDLF